MNLYNVTIKHPKRGITLLSGQVLADSGVQASVLVKDAYIDQYCKRYSTTWENIAADFWIGAECLAERASFVPTVLKFSFMQEPALNG